MEFFLPLLFAIYVGIGLYELYISYLFGQPIRECVINGIVWPVEMYYNIKDAVTRNYIDKDGP